jgi:hypothetical protein
MAGNKNQNTIYVEADYDNIILIDPNKIVVDGEVKDRLVEHEDLVFYANLETKVVPRTKLAVGLDLDSDVINTQIASLEGKKNVNPNQKGDDINFLRPKGKSAYDTSWSDQTTGMGSREGQGLNQTNEKQIENKDGTTRYVRTVTNYQDTQMLGIESIKIDITGGKSGGMFVPTVDIKLIDIQGRTLFEQGENSIYSVFFNLPYPIFYLTLKGYYGKAIRYSLNLTSFNASFDNNLGNFTIDLRLMGKNSGLLSDSLLDYAKTAPKMFPQVIETQQTPPINSTNKKVSTEQSSLGRQTLNEVYRIYKSKGLVNESFPNLSIDEFIEDADSFTTFMNQSIEQGDFVVLSDIDQFRKDLLEIKDRAYKVVLSSYLDTSNYILYDGQVYYAFKNILDFQKRQDIISAIKAEINNSLDNMRRNASFGENAEGKNQIPVTITDEEIFEDFDYNKLTFEDYKKTLAVRIGTTPTDEQVNNFITQINQDFLVKDLIKDINGNEIETFPTLIKYGEISFGGNKYVENSFLDKINNLKSKIDEREVEIENEISENLSLRFFSKDGGLGYEPTLRNVMAILIAGLDTFYRLMDKTHTDANSLRDNPKRVSTILPPDKNYSVDGKNTVQGVSEDIKNINIVYPWPTYFVEEKDNEGNNKYNIHYVGEPKYSDYTDGFDENVWPEVKFLENYLTASTQKNKEVRKNVYNNPQELSKYGSCNTIYFPFDNIPYENTSEVNFMYEMYERIYALSHYTKLQKSTFDKKQINKFLADLEAKNIISSALENPSLVEKLKNKKYNAQTLRDELRAISNYNGIGGLWSDFVRDKYVTESLRNDIEKDYGLYDMGTLSSRSISLDNNINLVKNFEEYLRSSEISEISFLDTIPYTDDSYVLDYTFAADAKTFNSTSKTYIFLDDKKTIARLNETEKYKDIKCFKTYAKKQFENFTTPILVSKFDNFQINDRETLKVFFEKNGRSTNYITVDNIVLDPLLYSGEVKTNTQTCSLLNTPYFLNALLKGIEIEKDPNNTNENPYTALGYLYVNSIPIVELSEPLVDLTSEESLDGFAATLKNFSSIHQIPYALTLKFGSIWHRYKKFIDTGIDILDNVWKDFDYKKYYDPFINNLQTQFKVKNYTGGTLDFKSFDIKPQQNLGNTEFYNTGFYPKLINDFYWYFTKKDLFTTYNQTEFDNLYDENKLKIGTNTNARYFMNFGGDPNNQNRSIIINPFFQYFTFDKDPLIDKNYKTHLLIPSNGGINLNQTVFECFDINNKLKIDISDNPAMYNGSVRSFWASPQFGYFDNRLITKPKYNEYLRLNEERLPKSIEDIFAVFKPEMLDLFEKAFLGFCKPNPTAEDIFILEKEQKSPTYSSTNKIKNIEQRSLFEQIKKIFLVRDNDVNLINQQNQDAYELAQKQTANITFSIKKFMNYDCVLKIGNAGNFDRRLFNSFLNETGYSPEDPETFEPYDAGTLPDKNNSISLIQSKANFNNEWKTLEKYVGFSTIKGADYTDTGSTITDFFIDLNVKFSESNIKRLYQIIKIYATQKLQKLKENKPYTKVEFKEALKNYINEVNLIGNNMVTEISTYLNKNLPDKKVKNNSNSTVEGETTKLSLYSVFQTLNDKWISGTDFQSKTLFEDFLFHDTANNDIGDKIQINLEDVRDLFKSDGGTDIYSIVGYLLELCGNMIFFSLPAYINFYGLQNPSKNPQAQDIDPANSLFGTWTNVDYINSTSKFLCVYTGKESEKPRQNDNSFVLYGDDSYDFRNPATNPNRIQDGKQNKSLSNKVVGFNVDFGIRNQNIFKNISVGMQDKKNTAATFMVRDNLAGAASGDKIGQQTASLYSFYKSLSYTCTVNSMANVMIQPMMYFNLRHVPLFYGPYLIYKVSHSISSDGNFTTDFTGSRMPKYALPQPESLGTYIKANYLQKYKAKILERKNTEGQPENFESILDPEQQKIEKEGLLSDQATCDKIVNDEYKTFPFVTVDKKVVTYEDLKILINDTLGPNTSDNVRNLKIVLFTIALTRPLNQSSGSEIIEPLNNNYFEINAVNKNNGNRPEFSKLICVNNSDVATPLFAFTGESDSIKIASSYLSQPIVLLPRLVTLNGTGNDAYYSGVSQFVITIWEAGLLNIDDPATSVVEELDESFIKNYVEINIEEGFITKNSFDSYVDVVKIAENYF